jgi:hypothetical protein
LLLKLMQYRYQYCKQCAIYLIMDQFLFKKHLDPHAAVFHNTKCSLAVPVSVLPIPTMYRRFPLFSSLLASGSVPALFFFDKLYQRNHRYHCLVCVYTMPVPVPAMFEYHE